MSTTENTPSGQNDKVENLVEMDGDRILGFAGFAVDAGEIMSSVQIAMIAGLSYAAVGEAILTHPTPIQGLNFLFATAPSKSMRLADQRGTARSSKKETRVVASEFATDKNGKGF
jgi:hypothetical protein